MLNSVRTLYETAPKQEPRDRVLITSSTEFVIMPNQLLKSIFEIYQSEAFSYILKEFEYSKFSKLTITIGKLYSQEDSEIAEGRL